MPSRLDQAVMGWREAIQRSAEQALATTGGGDHGDLFPGLDAEVNVLKQRGLTGISQADAVKDHAHAGLAAAKDATRRAHRVIERL